MHHLVIGVVGASGGLGASTLAVALAVRAGALLGAAACIDGDFAGGGLDVTACVEHVPGLRWPDLADARGDLDGAALLQALPRAGSLRVLAARGSSPGEAVVRAGLDALRTVCAVTVVDLGRSLDLAPACSEVLMLAGASARHLADADVTARALAPLTSGSARLVLRAGRRSDLDADEIAAHLEMGLAAVVRHDARVLRHAGRATLPGRRRTVLTGVAWDLLGQLGVDPAAEGRR
jgi:hypothetical protein